MSFPVFKIAPDNDICIFLIIIFVCSSSLPFLCLPRSVNTPLLFTDIYIFGRGRGRALIKVQ